MYTAIRLWLSGSARNRFQVGGSSLQLCHVDLRRITTQELEIDKWKTECNMIICHSWIFMASLRKQEVNHAVR